MMASAPVTSVMSMDPKNEMKSEAQTKDEGVKAEGIKAEETKAEETKAKKPAPPKNQFVDKYKALGKNVELLLYLYGLAALRDISKRYVISPYAARDNYDDYLKNQSASPSKSNHIGKIDKVAGMMIGVVFERIVEEIRALPNKSLLSNVGTARVTDMEDQEIKRRNPTGYALEVSRLLTHRRADIVAGILDEIETPTGLHYARVAANVLKTTRFSPTLQYASDHKEYFRKLLEINFKDSIIDLQIIGAIYALFDGFLRGIAQRLAPIVWHTDCGVTRDLIFGVIEQSYPLSDDYVNDLKETLKQIADQTPKSPKVVRKKSAKPMPKPEANPDPPKPKLPDTAK